MTLGTPQSALHFYDVSLVDGFNLPVPMKPVAQKGVSQVSLLVCLRQFALRLIAMLMMIQKGSTLAKHTAPNSIANSVY
ncbi:unnamed protein product [Lupinus luteus]|uniref:Uncharacterized protein n=1 Tax=Lupinus luteus TaxID=3873 RepID=A0AAV1X3L9_LUPLU